MPILNVKVSGQRDITVVKQINELLLDLTSRILKKKKEVTSIAISFIPSEDWTIGGQSMAELSKSTFYFDINITDETNTKDEKALYIKEAYAGFAKVLGDLHETSYIYVNDVRAATYGFGGFTQEYRYHH